MSYKKIFDPLHRFIHVDELENELIETVPFQRLQYIHQLGMAFLVYPGGTHKRFEHSLGVMELATRIYDQVTNIESEFVPARGTPEHGYWRQVLRLAALCHDMGHLPFSHTAERVVLGSEGHEGITKKIIESHYLEPIWKKVDSVRDVQGDVLKLALGEKKLSQITHRPVLFTPWERMVSEIITGDFFGADRIDYLLRDAQYTGLAYGMFDYHQLLETLRILPVGGGVQLGVEENGVESCEALILSRYFMYKRLALYSSVKGYSFHLARFIETYFGEQLTSGDLDLYLSVNDDDVVSHMHKVVRNPDMAGYVDAAALLMRKKRFKAIPLKTPISEDECRAIQKKYIIPDQEIGWEMDYSLAEPIILPFPVYKRDGTIVAAHELSDISIVHRPLSWIYVAQEHAHKCVGAV